VAPLPWSEAAVGGEADTQALRREIATKAGLSDKQAGL